MPDTLQAVATDELAKSQAEQTRAAAELATAQTDLAQAKQDLADATADLAAAEDAGALIQRKIAQTTIAADGQALFDDLDANTTLARSKQVAVVDAQERVADATSRIVTAQNELAQAAAAAAASQAALTVATSRDDDHTTWSNATTSAPLNNLPGKADVTAAGQAKTAADAALARLDDGSGGDLPHDLFQRAQERRAQRADRVAAVSTAATTAEDSEATAVAAGGLAGTATQAQLAFQRSEAALRDYALSAKQRFDRAMTLLAGVAAATSLNTDEKNRITTLATAATTANSYALQKARDDAQADVDTDQDAVDAAILAAITADPTADPSADAGVIAAVGTLTTDQGTLTNAQTAYDGAPKDALDALEASVPEAMWSAFSDYEEALSLLADLHAANPAQLATNLENDEDAYAQALRDVQDNTRLVLALAELSKGRDDRASTASQTQNSRLLQALRGDE
jgi:hypothetical protein